MRNLRQLLTSWPQNRNVAQIRCANKQVIEYKSISKVIYNFNDIIVVVNAIKTSSPVQSPVNKLNNANANNSNYQNQIPTNGVSSLANSRK